MRDTCPGKDKKVLLFKKKRRKAAIPRSRAQAVFYEHQGERDKGIKERKGVTEKLLIKRLGGSSRNGRDSNSQKARIKIYGGELVNARIDTCPSGRHQNPPGRTSGWAGILRFSRR